MIVYSLFWNTDGVRKRDEYLDIQTSKKKHYDTLPDQSKIMIITYRHNRDKINSKTESTKSLSIFLISVPITKIMLNSENNYKKTLSPPLLRSNLLYVTKCK